VYNPSFVGFYNTQGRKAAIYSNSWRIVSGGAASVASATQTTTAQQSAVAPSTKNTDGSWGAFSLKTKNYSTSKYNTNYTDLTDKRLFNGRKVVSGDTYTLKITYTASRALESDDLWVVIIDRTQAAKGYRQLSMPVRIPAYKEEEVSATVKLYVAFNSTGLSRDANILNFYIDEYTKKSLTLNFTEFVFTKD